MADKNKKESENQIFAGQKDPRKDDVYLDIAESKENWRRICFLIGLYAILSTGALIVYSFQAKFQPFIVKVNELNKPVAFGPAEPLARSDERLLRAEIYEWVTNLRSIYGSPALLKQQMNKAFSLVSSDVSGQLNQYLSIPENDPRNLIDRWRRSVEVRSIIPVDQAKGRWKIQWVETLISKKSQPMQRQAWEGFITVQHQAPTSSEGILQNPLGIYITELNWGAISPSTQNN